MHSPTISILSNQARTEDLHRAAQKFRQQQLAAATSRETRRRRRPRPAPIRRAIQQLKGGTTIKTAPAPSQHQ